MEKIKPNNYWLNLRRERELLQIVAWAQTQSKDVNKLTPTEIKQAMAKDPRELRCLFPN